MLPERRNYQQIKGGRQPSVGPHPHPYEYGSFYQKALQETDPESPFSPSDVRITHHAKALPSGRNNRWIW